MGETKPVGGFAGGAAVNSSLVLFPLCLTSCGAKAELGRLSTAGPEKTKQEDEGSHDDEEEEGSQCRAHHGLLFLFLFPVAGMRGM